MKQVEGAICIHTHAGDPDPNPPELICAGYRGKELVVKVRMDKSEIELLDRLLAPDLKCAVQVFWAETHEESKKVYDQFKSRIKKIASQWS